YPIARTCNCYQSGKKSIYCITEVEFSFCVAKPKSKKHGRNTATTCCQSRIGCYPANTLHIHCRKCASRIETIPAKPKDKTTNRSYGKVMRRRHSASISF